MKRMILASTFNLNDEDTQYAVAEWVKDYTLAQISNKVNKRRKKNPRQFWVDDFSWSADKVYFEIYEDDGSPQGKYITDFSVRLNFYDGPSESMDDVKYLVEDQVHDLLYEIR